MAFAGDIALLRRIDTVIGHVPGEMMVLTGFAIGALTSWAGWQAGKRPAVPAGGAMQPA